MVQSVDNVANIRYSCVSKRKKGRETKENLEKFKLEGENGAGGGPFQSIKKDTFALAASFGLAICDTSSKCAPAEGHSDHQISMRSPLHSLYRWIEFKTLQAWMHTLRMLNSRGVA